MLAMEVDRTNQPSYPQQDRYGTPSSPQQSRGGRSWLSQLLISVVSPIIAGIVMLLLSVGVISLIMRGETAREGGVDDNPAVQEVWSCGTGETKVVRIGVRGVLLDDEDPGLFGGMQPVRTALRHIRAATRDPDVKAIIVEIDSPGGGVTASDLIRRALVDFKAAGSGRKVVAVLGDMAASGGYYVATAADYILAHPTSLTGSYGVIISSLNVKQFGDKYGVKLVTVASGKNKDMMGPFSEMTEEQRTLLQQIVQEMHERFVTLIANCRPGLTRDEVAALADGRLFTAEKARELKLVDEVGYWEDALAGTGKLLGVPGVKVFRYKEEFGLSALLGASPAANLSPTALERLARPRMMYLWQL